MCGLVGVGAAPGAAAECCCQTSMAVCKLQAVCWCCCRVQGAGAYGKVELWSACWCCFRPLQGAAMAVHDSERVGACLMLPTNILCYLGSLLA